MKFKKCFLPILLMILLLSVTACTSAKAKGKSPAEDPKEAASEETPPEEASGFKVGEEYYTLAREGLNVRSDPSKDNGDNVVDSLVLGTRVTCEEMSGNWMRVSSGWICVEDEGEKLVGDTHPLVGMWRPHVEDYNGAESDPEYAAKIETMYIQLNADGTYEAVRDSDFTWIETGEDPFSKSSGTWRFDSYYLYLSFEPEEWLMNYNSDNNTIDDPSSHSIYYLQD